MRTFFVCTAGVALLLATPALADPPGVQPAGISTEEVAPKTREQRLDELFVQLKRERNERSAERIATRIRKEWNNSGNAVIDLMMQWSQQAMEKKKFDVALDFLDQVVTLSPDYSEGWNRRATVHFMMHNFAKSMSDINQTLRLEPRHFGALAGMAEILKQSERKELALKAFERVLVIYPMMRGAQNEIATISEEITGDRI